MKQRFQSWFCSLCLKGFNCEQDISSSLYISKEVCVSTARLQVGKKVNEFAFVFCLFVFLSNTGERISLSMILFLQEEAAVMGR